MKTLRSEPPASYVIGPNLWNEDEIVTEALRILQSRVQPGASMNSPQTVRNYLVLSENTDSVEEFRVMWLDAQHRVINVESLSRGTLTQASVYPREVVKAGLKHNAAAVIISHNHPSGTLAASDADKAMTVQLKKALELVDIRLIDHVITAGGDSMSFAEYGYI